MKLTPDQKQIILGTLLGNGRLESSTKGPYLLMKSRDENWLRSKAHALSNIEQATWRSRNNYYWRSIASPEFVFFDELIYDHHNKTIRMPTLDILRDIAITTWYGDVGCLVGRNRRNACLRTQSFGSSNEIAAQFFNEVSATCNVNQVRNKPVLVFTIQGTLVLMQIIANLLPPNRHHLIPSINLGL